MSHTDLCLGINRTILSRLSVTYNFFSNTRKLLIRLEHLCLLENTDEDHPKTRIINVVKFNVKTERLKFICPTDNCQSTFHWKRNLQRHFKSRRCGMEPRFQCPYCDYKCKDINAVPEHIKTRHKSRSVYVIDSEPNSTVTSLVSWSAKIHTQQL